MAIKLETVIHRWKGISSDIKPDPASGVTEGSTFKCTDTGEKYYFHNGMWEPEKNVLDEF